MKEGVCEGGKEEDGRERVEYVRVGRGTGARERYFLVQMQLYFK